MAVSLIYLIKMPSNETSAWYLLQVLAVVQPDEQDRVRLVAEIVADIQEPIPVTASAHFSELISLSLHPFSTLLSIAFSSSFSPLTRTAAGGAWTPRKASAGVEDCSR